MKADEMALDYAKQLKEYCEVHDDGCNSCIFYQESDFQTSYCLPRKTITDFWEIED